MRSTAVVDLAILAKWPQNEFAFGDSWVGKSEDFLIQDYVVIE